MKIQTWHVERFAAFVKKLAAVKDGDGTLLDHSMFLYGSNMSNSDKHNGHPLPTVLVGGGNGKLRGSQHIDPGQPTPIAVHLTILDKINARQEKFGDNARPHRERVTETTAPAGLRGLMLDRRQLMTRVIGAVIAGLAVPRRGAAPVTTAASDRLSLITSGGTNVLALSAPDGLVLVDSGAPDRSDGRGNALKSLSGGVRTVFNTHYHPDNTGANEMLRQGGATIVAHENTRLWMATPVWNPARIATAHRAPLAAQPTKTFRTEDSMTVGGERVDYGYLIEAHTSGDIYVHFRGANVLAVGDVAAPTRDPELDYFTGAWIGGRVDAMDRLLAL